jgi:hypothetical protein
MDVCYPRARSPPSNKGMYEIRDENKLFLNPQRNHLALGTEDRRLLEVVVTTS